MDVSVIVPAYNNVSTIGECLNSILQQDYPSGSAEVILIDNGSSDGTVAVAEKYGVKLVVEPMRGAYAARNRGIHTADGALLAFTDADCVAEPDWLTQLTRPFHDSTVGVVGGRIVCRPADSTLVEAFLAQVRYSSEIRFDPAEPKGFAGGNVAYRRSVLHHVGIFDAAMKGGGDIDLSWRVQAYGGYSGVYAPKAVVHHKHRSTLKGLFQQYRRYGYSEIGLSTLYRGEPFHGRTPRYQLSGMTRQLRALCTYPISCLVRLLRWDRWRTDRLYLAWPMLWFVLDSGLLLGKVEGLLDTRFFRQNPYSTNVQEVKRDILHEGSLVAADVRD